MLFWLIAAFLTLVASLAVLVPLAGPAKGAEPVASHDLEVYRDQLAELERDVGRGLVRPADAEHARAEIGRRILRLDAGRSDASAAQSRRMRLIPAIAILIVPVLSWGLYARIGSPDLPSQPLSARLAKNPADSSVDELVARAETHLAADPQDGRGWDVLAPVYLRMGRFQDAVTAYRNAIRLDGSSAARQAGLGEALANLSGGIVTAEAQSAFEAALATEPANAKASFFLAMGLAQAGQGAKAVEAWQTMLTRLPADSPWRDAVTQALAEAGQPDTARNKAGPNDADMTAAAAMSPQDRGAMIETMVAGLDDKLRKNPRDPEGWKRLIRSYVVLGKADRARDALQRSKVVFGPDSAEGKQMTAFAASLGLAATE